MDAVEFMKEWRRMCDVTDCDDCSIKKECKCGTAGFYPYYIREFENIVSGVEQWSKEHPRKTRAQDLFEKYPNAPKTHYGVPSVCAAALGYRDFCEVGCEDINCKKCWNEPV